MMGGRFRRPNNSLLLLGWKRKPFANKCNKAFDVFIRLLYAIASRTWRWKKGHSSRSNITKGKNEQVVSCNTDSKSVSSFYTRYKPIAKVLYNSSPSRLCYCESPVAAPARAPFATGLLGEVGESKRITRNGIRLHVVDDRMQNIIAELWLSTVAVVSAA